MSFTSASEISSGLFGGGASCAPIIKLCPEPGRSIDDAIRLAKAYEATFPTRPLPDEDFAKEVQA